MWVEWKEGTTWCAVATLPANIFGTAPTSKNMTLARLGIWSGTHDNPEGATANIKTKIPYQVFRR